VSLGSASGNFLTLEDEGISPLKHQKPLNQPHSVISQKIRILSHISVKASRFTGIGTHSVARPMLFTSLGCEQKILEPMG